MLKKKKIISIILFYLIAYLIVYITTPILLSYLKMPSHLSSLLLINIVILAGMLIITSILLILVPTKGNLLSGFGIRKDRIGNSFFWAAAFSTPIPLVWLVGIEIVGVDTMLAAAQPSWANPPISPRVVLMALFFWLFTGIIAIIFLEVFPYEFMNDFPKKLVVPLIVVFWAGLYNTPFLTGKFDPFDVLFFGLFFTFAYHKTRNSLGILLVYLLNENPLWWVIAAAFESNIEIVFRASLLLRLLICSLSACWLSERKILAIEREKNTGFRFFVH